MFFLICFQTLTHDGSSSVPVAPLQAQVHAIAPPECQRIAHANRSTTTHAGFGHVCDAAHKVLITIGPPIEWVETRPEAIISYVLGIVTLLRHVKELPFRSHHHVAQCLVMDACIQQSVMCLLGCLRRKPHPIIGTDIVKQRQMGKQLQDMLKGWIVCGHLHDHESKSWHSVPGNSTFRAQLRIFCRCP